MIEIINRDLISSEQYFRLRFSYQYEHKIYEIDLRYKKIESHFDSIKNSIKIIVLGGFIDNEQDTELIDKIVDLFIIDLKKQLYSYLFGEYDEIQW